MRVTARVIYGLDALVDLAAAGAPVKGEVLASRHEVSVGFLENILADLRRAGLVQSKRGGNGGYWLASHGRHRRSTSSGSSTAPVGPRPAWATACRRCGTPSPPPRWPPPRRSRWSRWPRTGSRPDERRHRRDPRRDR